MVSGKDALKYILYTTVTKLVVEYNMGTYHSKDQLMLKGQEKATN